MRVELKTMTTNSKWQPTLEPFFHLEIVSIEQRFLYHFPLVPFAPVGKVTKIKEAKKKIGEDSSNLAGGGVNMTMGEKMTEKEKEQSEGQVISMMEQLYWAAAIHRTSVRAHSLATLSATSKRRELSGAVAPRAPPSPQPRCCCPFVLILYPVHALNGPSEIWITTSILCRASQRH